MIGQNQKQIIKYADQLFNEGNFYGSSIYFKKAIELDSSDIHTLYKYASSLKNYNNYSLASYYFKKICEKDKGGRIYKDASFWLASMQKYNGQYRTASHTWKKVKSLYKNDKKGYHYKKAMREISSCVFAMRSIHNSNDHCTVKNLGDGRIVRALSMLLDL